MATREGDEAKGVDTGDVRLQVDVPPAFRDDYPEAYAEVRDAVRTGRLNLTDGTCVRVAGPPAAVGDKRDDQPFEHIVVLPDDESEAHDESEDMAAHRKRIPGRRDSATLTFTVEEAGEKLGISRALAYEAVRTGQIPSIRIGKRILVPKAALLRLLEAS